MEIAAAVGAGSFRAAQRRGPHYKWTDTSTVELYGDDIESPIPAAYRSLEPGIHDGIKDHGRAKVVLVREVRGRLLVLALDITEVQKHEDSLGLWMLGSNVLAILVLGLLVGWGLGRVIKPLSDMAERIRRLQPDQPGQVIEADGRASSEQRVISEALNDYLKRNDEFVERERIFINSVSHELRTPVAVISGAVELALTYPDTQGPVRNQLQRIKQTTDNVGELISILLVLAKDPARLNASSDYLQLDELIPEIIQDHRHLSRDNALEVTFQAESACVIFAPISIVQAVIGNLLRNAIENSGRGTITITLCGPATLHIDDPGQAMTPEEISALYSRMARGQSRQGNGIGLELIARLCGHLGWRLSFTNAAGGGTRATLAMQHGDIGVP